MKILLSALAGAALLASSAMAQTLTPPLAPAVIAEHDANAPILTPGDDSQNPQANNRQSRNYDALVGANSSFRTQRMHKECDPIASSDLRQECYASFGAGSSGYGSSGMLDRSGGLAR